MILLLAVIYVVFISLGLPDSLFGVSWPVELGLDRYRHELKTKYNTGKER